MSGLYKAANQALDHLSSGGLREVASTLNTALTAQRDEWKERRDEAAGHRAWERFPYRGNLLIGERAANEYFGYSADGLVDYLKEDKP